MNIFPGIHTVSFPLMHLINIALIAICAFAIIILITMMTNLFLFVPYVPTPKSVVKFMIEKARLKGDETVYDLGCGDARLLTETKKIYPNIKAIGYELSLGVWIIAKLRALISQKDIELHLRDFNHANLSDADVLLIYLVPEVMNKLKKKLDTELKPGSRVISHGFAIPEKEPVEVERCPLPRWHFFRPPGKEGPRVFVYEW